MIRTERFIFNSFQVNTYLLFDETRECVIIDPANHGDQENSALNTAISEHKLTPLMIINTHCHIDHVQGISFLKKQFGIPLLAHREEARILEKAPVMGELFGLRIDTLPEIDRFIAHNESITFGNSSLTALHVPGHSPGSLAFYAEQDAFAVTGDALFAAGIGRTDLPGGDYDSLIESIKKQLFSLPPETTIWPGHGGSSTIGFETENNPFFK